MLQQKRIIARLAILSTLSVLATSTFTASVQASMPHPPSGVLTKDVVITATKTKENIRLVSQSVEVITAKDIEKLGATSVTDIFAYTFGVDTSRSNHGTALQIRGLSSSHTLFLIDGERISGEDTPQLANTKVLQRINISEIDRIEIVRGTGSSLYGSDAIGGIINIITKQSNQKSKTILSYGAGTKRTMGSLHTNFGTPGTFFGTLD
ncbi:TonB-dependent siderophore receptor [uncultured Megasphaera sp.]|uniref:TonB-dependent receptor plug domain-containing protein n=1 Tax=uncultured Megasphaera sp. TaxID=165188 RepID=UPI002596C4A9|nr:TonB-dependent receptor plug domain-containing protein [uncultured Megasphaera sp.]